MRRYLTALSLATLLCFSSLLSAQDTTSGETFTDFAAFEAEVCGTIVGGGLDSENFTNRTILGDVFSTFDSAQTIAGGQVESSGSILFASVGLLSDFVESDACLVAGLAAGQAEDFSLTFTPDPASGNVEGFCIDYIGNPVITIFDGDTVVDTITAAPTAVGVETATICWLNTDLANVTRIQFDDATESDISLVCGFQFAFGEQGCNDVETCRSLLRDVIADVATIVPVEGTYDQQLLDCAIAYLGCADHDSLWINDDQVENCNVFFFLYKATKYLSFVSESSEATQAMADIQAVLSCLVDTEIAAAIAAGGDAGLIECAAYYQSCADAYQEVGFFRKAAVLRKLAWYKAVLAY